MSDKKNVQQEQTGEEVIAKAKDFWAKYSKIILIAGTALILVVGGFFAYKNFIRIPKEEKAAEAMFKAEDYYRRDSVNLALNGDGQYQGFLKIMSKYSGTEAANLASFYAGSCYIKLDDNANAIKYLKKFSTDAKQIQQRMRRFYLSISTPRPSLPTLVAGRAGGRPISTCPTGISNTRSPGTVSPPPCSACSPPTRGAGCIRADFGAKPSPLRPRPGRVSAQSRGFSQRL